MLIENLPFVTPCSLRKRREGEDARNTCLGQSSVNGRRDDRDGAWT